MAYTTVNKSSDNYKTVKFTGNGTSPRTISDVGFQPDWTILKPRNLAYSWTTVDAIRTATGGGTNSGTLLLNTTDAPEGNSNGNGAITGFASNGFTMTTGTSDFNRVNGSYNYCSWNFKANGTGSANSDGATASTVSANTTSGFSIVKWSGTGSNTTVGHGLGAVPRFIIVKGLGSGKNWATYHAELGNTKGLHLNENYASSTETSWWNSTSPTSSVFTVGTSANVNASGTDYMAYVFAEKVGHSKAGIYTGNGSSSGVFVYTGFRPSFVLIKNPNGTNPPELRDDQRVNNYNPANGRLWVNKSDTEATENMDFLSNGFKFRSSDATTNGSNSYVYFAIGQSLVGSNNVPCTAR